jgi:hypothetical protein
MSDPRRPDGPEQKGPPWSQPTQPLGYNDPAYAGQFTYPSYVPPSAPHPTEPLPSYWTQTQHQPPGQPPPNEPPPGPPKSPRWLWIVAAAAVLLVVGLVIALVIANSSSKQDTVVAPLPPMPESTSTAPTTTSRTPTTTSSRSPSTTTAIAPPTGPSTTQSGATDTVVYTVTGQGRAISITYVDAGGMLQIEFNVALPWTREVSLTAPASSAASVTVLNVGREITCTVTVNGAQVRERTGTGLTICASAG